MLKTPAIRLSFVLSLFMVNLLVLGNMIGFVPDESDSVLELRKGLSESLALQFSAVAEKGEFQIIRNTLRAVVERNDDIRSAAIRSEDGKLIALAGEHLMHWKKTGDGKSTPMHVQVPVYSKGKRWATVEIRFAPLWMESLGSRLFHSFAGLVVFVGLAGFILNFFVLKRSLRELDPSSVIPERVQKAFDILKEGVLIMDDKEHIVMANRSFAGLFDKSPDVMIGLKGSELGWLDCQAPEEIRQLPWLKVLDGEQEQKGTLLTMLSRLGTTIKLVVNAARVVDGTGASRGVLVTFDDVTELEEKNFELNEMVGTLQLANEEIEGKSKDLEKLANYDPMTQCLNRRSLGQKFDALFSRAKAEGGQLACLMVDIDFFKKVNDNYGHAAGDTVIKAVADVLKNSTRDTDLVGRYGGEEFCVVLPRISIDKAVEIAERIRLEVESKSCDGIQVTVSQGVSSLELNACNREELINQADKALYAAKESGRNRVVTWGQDMPSAPEGDGVVAENREPVSQPEKAEANDGQLAKLQRRVSELEGLLEKRNLELEHYKMYDFNTGLPTRSLFEDRMKHAITRGKRMNTLLGVLSVTIDTIKRAYEAFGGNVAEQLVKECGERLNDVLRENIDTVAVIKKFNEMSSVSLLSQTEFGIMLVDIRQVDHVAWVMKRMLDSFKKPFHIQGNEIYTTPYFGVSIFPHDGQTVETLCSNATNACRYAQKLNLKEHYLFSSPELNEMAVKQLRIESLLHDAIQNDELELHYQPKVETTTGRVAGFEALLRWQSDILGAVPPDCFIPIAEQAGLIEELGEWVLNTACRQLRTWMDLGFEVGSIAVNLSGLQLRQKNLDRVIQRVLDQFKIDYHLLELELTESFFVNNNDNSLAMLKQIRSLGLRVAMDDFGTGYSSLAYLKNIPLSSIKIDKSFVDGIDKDEKSNKLIDSIVSIAHGLGLEVVAEGVEEKCQADYLITLGCDYLQGYYFSHPLSRHDVTAVLKNKTPFYLGWETPLFAKMADQPSTLSGPEK